MNQAEYDKKRAEIIETFKGDLSAQTQHLELLHQHFISNGGSGFVPPEQVSNAAMNNVDVWDGEKLISEHGQNVADPTLEQLAHTATGDLGGSGVQSLNFSSEDEIARLAGGGS